ncbi:hypothetical protein EX895_004003 [Sporisorium graminicola]|uniref:Uncharacterized protein n=1 Tax=Sporisorium graminicola TaxID=280036 RepID=A0A4U7KTA9_9BASI|nr:hypothetical protein EX895_004003 [Sporisorium graminicola]TKY87326.1 hypothetical protein EX895_004003 [Sporisorium graminicola]
MSAPVLPGAQPGPSSRPTAPASQRAIEIQNALKSIVLETASTLRSRTQQARLHSLLPSSSAVETVSESSSSLNKLTTECTRYLSLVHGLRDYLLHAQAALEIELEAATQREAQEAKRAAEAAAEALKRQQEVEEAAKKKAEEEAERKRIEDEERASKAGPMEADKEAAINAAGAGTKPEDDPMTGLAAPLLPAGVDKKDENSDVKQLDAGTAADDAIVIDSDGDDEDDVPLAFAPKAGAAEGASKTIDLTQSPARLNAANPISTDPAASSSTQPSEAAAATTSTKQDTISASTAAPTGPVTAAATFPGLDLSALGIDVSSLNNLPDLSSLGIPSLSNASSTDTSTALAPASDLSELEKMMGIDLSSSAATANNGASISGDGASSNTLLDASSLGSFGSGVGTGGFGEDTDMYGSGLGGLDLSNFDFSSLAGGAGGDASVGGSGGVDLSSFLTSFTSSTGEEGNQESTN